MVSWVQVLEQMSWDGELLLDYPLCRATTFRIGGPAKAFLEVGSQSDLIRALSFAKANGIAVFVMGNGSNVLAPDAGYDGLIVHLGSRFSAITIEGQCIVAQAGALLSTLCMTAVHHGLAGLEFCGGIPGSVGGGVYMNAGAYGGQMSDCVIGAAVLQGDQVVFWDNQRLDFSYRHSALMHGGIVLEATFALTPADPMQLLDRVQALNTQRREKQPISLPSAGSAFKRPLGAYAAALIDQCGLKGLQVGMAQVSQKHAGFIVNLGGATAADVLQLCRQVQKVVFEKTGYRLEREFISL